MIDNGLGQSLAVGGRDLLVSDVSYFLREVHVRMRAADLLIETLVQAGIGRIFTLSGNQIMPVFDACIETSVKLIHVRHEAAAVHMADAWGRLTGEPGVALVTAGPGFANSLSALYVAFMAESPLVLISGASPRHRDGQGAFQEMPQAEIAGHFTKESWAVTDPSQIGHALARAVRLAKSDRPGPIHLAVPGEVFSEMVQHPQQARPHQDDFAPATSMLDATTAQHVLTTLAEAKKPVILGGTALTHGDGAGRLEQLGQVLNVPAVAMGSPRGLKDPSLGKFREVLQQADVVLLLARSLNFSLRFGEEPAFHPDCKFLMIDPQMPTIEQAARNLGGSSRLLVADLADARPAVESLLQLADPSDSRSNNWRSEFQQAVMYRPHEWQTDVSSQAGPIHPAELCLALNRMLATDDEAVFVSDGGEFGQWAQACITAPHRIINGPSGSIGGGISFALSARLAFPNSKVLATVGDGTFGFHAMEFDTAVRYNLPMVVVVGNDACWNSERQIQLHDYGSERQLGCDLLPTRYDEVARMLGGCGEFVTRPDEIEPALQRAFAAGKPTCVNVMIQSLAAPE